MILPSVPRGGLSPVNWLSAHAEQNDDSTNADHDRDSVHADHVGDHIGDSRNADHKDDSVHAEPDGDDNDDFVVGYDIGAIYCT